jgi:ABC-2 type transport system permease protein
MICGALFLVGEESFTRNFGTSTATLLQEIGTGARFRSVARGVLDLGDLVYYATIVGSALVANVFALEWRRG